MSMFQECFHMKIMEVAPLPIYSARKKWEDMPKDVTLKVSISGAFGQLAPYFRLVKQLLPSVHSNGCIWLGRWLAGLWLIRKRVKKNHQIQSYFRSSQYPKASFCPFHYIREGKENKTSLQVKRDLQLLLPFGLLGDYLLLFE